MKAREAVNGAPNEVWRFLMTPSLPRTTAGGPTSRRMNRVPKRGVGCMTLRAGFVALAALSVAFLLASIQTVRAAEREEAVPALLVNALGYLADAPKRVVSKSGVEFRVVTEAGEVVHRGRFEKDGGALGPWFGGDFTEVRADGVYRIESGEERSHPFAIGASVDARYRQALRAAATWFRKGHANYRDDPKKSAKWMNDGLRSDNGQPQDFAGGWQDTGVDQRKFVITNAQGVWALLHVRARQGALWKDAPDWLTTEIRWGSDWLHKMQYPDGHLYYGIDFKRWN
jgi:hypothetical protein